MKQINKYIILLAFLALALQSVNAQDAPGRTTNTIIADALAQLPANNPKLYQATFTSLVSTGEEGLLSLIQMLKTPDTESNKVVEFAISGWTDFVENDTQKREIAANAFAKALGEPLNNEVKAFLVRQLALIANDNQINVLSGFIQGKILSAPAIQALAAIGSDKANTALLNALQNTDSEDITVNLVKALAYTEYAGAETALLRLFQNNPSEQLIEILPHALYKTGGSMSLIPLKNAANRLDYSYQKNNATDSYVGLLKKIVPLHPNIVQKEANDLLKRTTKSGVQNLRVAAMEILMSVPNIDKTKLLKIALKDSDKLFLTKTLEFYSTYKNEKGINLIVNKLKKTTDPNIAETLVYWLGNERIVTAVPSITKQLNSKDKNLQAAAVKSLSKIGDEDALTVIIGLLASDDKDLIMQAKQELLTINNPNLSDQLAAIYTSGSNVGKVAVLEIIGHKRLVELYPLVYAQLKSSTDKTIKEQAAKSLRFVVTDKNLSDLFLLLEQSNGDNTFALQEAVNEALSYLSPEEQSKRVAVQMSTSNNKHLYYSALANSGTSLGMDKILNDYKTLSGKEKNAAFDALTKWKNFDGVYVLLEVARNSKDKVELGKAVDALTRLIDKSDKNGEVKGLYLRETMQFAQNDKQKNTLLRLLGNTNSYKALIYTATFLDEPALKETAAQAVMNISLENPSFLDENTEFILGKVSNTLNNPDASYQREAIAKYLSENPKIKGFISLFNGKDLSGWKGLVGDPLKRAKMTKKEMEKAQKEADEAAQKNWVAENGELIFTGKGNNLCTNKQYGDFELLIDWKLYPGKETDAGIYLRGNPQVQIWDTARVKAGAQVGSGGLYNNKTHPSKPLKAVDEKLGEWNHFRIKMIGDRVTVWLNGELVVDNVILENYWDRNLPIPALEQIELQAHGSKVAYRDILIREIPRPEPFKLSKQEEKEGYKILFDGTNMHEWTGNTNDYIIEDGVMAVYPNKQFKGSTRNLYTKKEYDNFVFRFEFQLTPGANNGLGIRTPMEGDAAYVGMELQILDNDAPIYEKLQIYQYHGSVYGVIPAKRGFLKPVGEWNYQEVVANGDNIKITLNGEVILDGNLRDAVKNGTMDKKEHPGLFNEKGHIGFLGHGSVVKFRNIRIKEL